MNISGRPPCSVCYRGVPLQLQTYQTFMFHFTYPNGATLLYTHRTELQYKLTESLGDKVRVIFFLLLEFVL